MAALVDTMTNQASTSSEPTSSSSPSPSTISRFETPLRPSTATEQQPSTLLLLPAELRLEIYTHHFALLLTALSTALENPTAHTSLTHLHAILHPPLLIAHPPLAAEAELQHQIALRAAARLISRKKLELELFLSTGGCFGWDGAKGVFKGMGKGTECCGMAIHAVWMEAGRRVRVLGGWEGAVDEALRKS